MKIKAIEWSDVQKPSNGINYDHCIGYTPLGEFVITWKSWKERPDYDIEVTPFTVGNVFTPYYSLEDAMDACQEYFNGMLGHCIE